MSARQCDSSRGVMTRCWIARHEFLALQEEALEKRKVMAEIARKEKEARQKGQKGGKKPPPKKAPQRQKVQQQRSLISVDGQPSGELGRIYMAAPKDKHLAMLPSNRMPVSCLQVFKRGLILLRMLLHDSGYAVCGVCVACGIESCARLIFCVVHAGSEPEAATFYPLSSDGSCCGRRRRCGWLRLCSSSKRGLRRNGH